MSASLPITLITGLPGTGKTAHAVDCLAHGAEFKGSPFFVMGIDELKVEHEPCPPVSEWTTVRQAPEDPSKSLYYFAFPPNSVVVVDEAQRVYRPRSAASRVPAEVAAFETVRHTGVRFLLLTQDATLLDSNIRKLVGRHIHFRATALGTYRYEWVGLGDPDNKSSRDQAARSKYKPPKRVFGLYKSAELHTTAKVKMPGYVYLLALAVLSLAGAGAYLYNTIKAKTETATPSQNLDLLKSTGARPVSGSPPGQTRSEYLAAQNPRVAGLLHTAPAYDQITMPTEAPIIAGCVTSKKTGCNCYDQRGGKYRTTTEICQQFLDGGIFFAFLPDPVKQNAAPDKVTGGAPATTGTWQGAQSAGYGSGEKFAGTHIRPLDGGSHIHSGGFSPVAPKAEDPVYILVPKG